MLAVQSGDDAMGRLGVASAAVVLCLLTMTTAPVGGADASTCRVTNVTRSTTGHSLKQAVRAANDGDHLRVRGRCIGGVIIGKDLAITGADDAVITGQDRYRVFLIKDGATVKLRHLVVARGNGRHDGIRGGGGGIYNEGTTTLSDSIVRRAWSGEDPGGAITNVGTMRVVDSLVRHSRADWGGGIGNYGTLTVVRSRVLDDRPEGIWSRGPTSIIDSVVRSNDLGGVFVGGTSDVTIRRSIIRDNGAGRGITKAGAGALTLESCLISGNVSAGDGAGIYTHRGQLTLVGTTVTANTAARHGGGLYVVDGTTTVTLDETSMITGNTPDDCYGTTAC
jgi:hypothetical protein